MCEHEPSWTGPWYSYHAQVVRDNSVIVDEIHEYRRHVYCETCPDFWTQKLNIEELWEKGIRYRHLPGVRGCE